MSKERYIVHIDMDAFFASVEQRDNPEYQGKPVIVGADPKGGKGRGVVSACSYEARKFGIHSALPISFAYRKCPQGIFLRVNLKEYARVSKEIFKILGKFSPDLEPVSIDEAFMDITGSYHLFGSPEDTCLKIKAAIKKETRLTASIGMAPNKMTAKIASDMEKPDGFVIVSTKGLLDFLHPLPVEKIWGVGGKTLEAFRRIGINTIGELAKQDKNSFHKNFGKHGDHVWKLANGIDPRDVRPGEIVKSVGNEHTFSEDVSEKEKILDTLMYLSEKVSRRLRKSGFKGRTITLKIRFSDFKTFTRASSLNSPTNFVEDIFRSTANKFENFDLKKKAVRLIGVQVSNLAIQVQQIELFKDNSGQGEKKEKLAKAMDQIKDKFGEKAIKHRG